MRSYWTSQAHPLGWMGWLLIGILAGTTGLSQTYSVKDLGVITDVAGGSESRPNSINKDGHIAAVNLTDGHYRAIVHSGSWTDIGTLGGLEALASGIDDSGRVAGYSRTAEGAIHAFLWTPGANDGIPGNPQMKDLGTLGGTNSQGMDINNLGWVTGYSDTAEQPTLRQRVFSYRDLKMTDVGKQLSGLPMSFGYAINSAGHLAGTAYDASYTTPHAFFYDGTKGVDLGPVGGQGSQALGINETDHIAGYLTTADYLDHAFHYFNGTVTDLGTLGGHYSYGIGINNGNAIVGGSFVDSNDTVYHAFLWANNKMQDLNAVLDSTGAGWVLVDARAINDAGQIVGTGTLNGASHMFLLTPNSGGPAPSITSVRISGKDLVLNLQSVAQATYSVQKANSVSPAAWMDTKTGILGNGGIVSVTLTDAVNQECGFYRVKKTSP